MKTQPESEPEKTIINCFENEPQRDIDFLKKGLSFDLVPKYVKQALYKAKKWPLVFIGGVGTGKTCAAMLLYQRFKSKQFKKVFEKGLEFDLEYGLQFMDFSILVRKLTLHWIEPGQIVGERLMRTDEVLDWISRQRFVIFDDILTRNPTPAQADIAYELCKARLDKPTIYTCNLDPAAIAKVLDERFADRVLSGTIIKFKGKSMRTGV